MEGTRRSAASLVLVLVLCCAGMALWLMHARAWDLGRRSPILNYDSAQYALAGRELAEHGRLATPFALPLELQRYARPPWPLAVVQPGLVLVEGGLFKLAPAPRMARTDGLTQSRRPAPEAWLVLILPFCCFLMIGVMLGTGASILTVDAGPAAARVVGATVGLAFLLDPEAQHLATGGFTEMPFTLGLLIGVMLLVRGTAARRPLVFGLMLGVAGLFRGNMLWLIPAFALGGAATAPAGRRVRVALLTVLGYALPLAPWWAYKWRTFGQPGWDLSLIAVWEGVEGRTWFSLVHLPEFPPLPHGGEAVRLLAAKLGRNVPRLLLSMLTGPRALWCGTLAAYVALPGARRELRVAGGVVLATAALNLLAAAIGVPMLRYLFPARVLLEAAGLLAALALLARLRAPDVSVPLRQALAAFVVLLALGWGGWQTKLGLDEATSAAFDRGLPDSDTMEAIAEQLRDAVPPGEPVMSNLGPNLAWAARRPVVHLALTPADVDACRRRLDFHHVLVVFRDAAKAWPGWTEVVAHPAEAPRHPEWNVRQVREYRTGDGFMVVWLELGPLAPQLASVTSATSASTH